jgi:hypothetical protein
MAKYRVTTTIETTRVVDADNPFQAAVLVGGNVTDVRPARGRVAGASKATKPVKKVAKKRKPLSSEARAKLARNLVKARAARARNLKATKKTTKKRPAKKTVGATKKR